MTIKDINVWFKTNVLSLNLDNTSFMHSITKNSSCTDKNVGSDNKLISNTSSLKFLGLITDDTLIWECPIERTVPKLSAACFVVRVVKHETP
jgi:hypothetical protein